MEKFKEKRSSEVLLVISVIMGILSLITFFIGLFTNSMIGLGILGLPISAILTFISKGLSTQDSYTREFLLYMRKKLKSAKTLEELYQIEKEFRELAIKDKMYNLSFPMDLRQIHQEINNKIEILEML